MTNPTPLPFNITRCEGDHCPVEVKHNCSRFLDRKTGKYGHPNLCQSKYFEHKITEREQSA